MSHKFKVGEVVEIVGSVSHPKLNGTDCEIESVLGEIHVSGKRGMFYGIRLPAGQVQIAAEWTLRRKHPPTTGEQMIRAMFDAPPVERRRTETAWQSQYDTIQALMTMGVRVKPGVWPVGAV